MNTMAPTATPTRTPEPVTAFHPLSLCCPDNLTDVWDDIPPVRHWKFKSRKRTANQLSTKLLDRVIQISTEEDDVVLDPFGGSGTAYVCLN